MVRYFLLFSFLLVHFLPTPSLLYATSQTENRPIKYISDVLIINLKDSLKAPYSTTGRVTSGDPVTIIDEQKSYYQVETAEGDTGWISKKYIKDEIPKPLIIKQLKQELSELKSQLSNDSSTNPLSSRASETAMLAIDAGECQELEYDINIAKSEIERLLQQNIKLQNLVNESQKVESDELLSDVITDLKEEVLASKNQIKQTTRKYTVLVAEFEKRGEEIAGLQSNIAKHDDKTRFFWFGAGAIVFFAGLLAGKSGNRKINKFM